MSVINSIPLIAAGDDGYRISRSVRLRRSASAYFNRTFGTPTNANIWSLSGWAKRGLLGTQISLFGASVSSYTSITFLSGDTLRINLGNGTNGSLVTTQVFRDPSAYYHIAIAYDSTQATASNRIKLYINGVQVTSFSTASYPALNVSAEWNYSGAVGTIGTAATEYWDGYLTEVNFIDGQALTPSSFGETDAVTGVWKPKKYAGTYGTNGFYLNFADNSAATTAAIGKDSSGNGNNWTPNNISVTAGVTYDSMIDVPTMWADGGNGRGNYAVWSKVDTNSGGTTIWNAGISNNDAGSDVQLRSTIAVNSGKWYYEWTFQSAGTGYSHVGLATVDSSLLASYLGSTATSWSIFLSNGNKRNSGSYLAYGSGVVANDVIQCAFDVDSGKVWWGKNGTWFASGDPVAGTNAAFTNLSGTIAASCTPRDISHVNFGQRPFAYTPPTGFKALNTQNLPDATIKKGNQYFDVSTWTGNSTSRSITNSGAMQPDLVWAKCRSTGYNHALFDSVRGVNKALFSSSAAAEISPSASGGVSSFNSNGFSLQIGTSDWNQVNTNGDTYVGWQWKANGSAVTNTSGSITSQVNAGTAQGFSVVTYTGTGANATVGHGLGVAPKLIILKDRTRSDRQWPVYHASLGAVNVGFLNLTNTWASSPTTWNSTVPTSTVFSLGSDLTSNQSGDAFVAYLFAEVAGFSKFGSYTGNGSADGPFVYLGFRPRFVMIKNTAIGSNWAIWDTSRSAYNQVQDYLLPNLSAAEGNASTVSIDVTANGFKVRGTDTGINGSGNTIIYAAFAENPFKNSLAR
jgi:hypothetical protein